MKIFDTKRLRVRKLTPKEYGILQAFPMDDWKQVVSDSQAYKQFGNAVTTTVFTAIAEEIAKSIYAAEESEEQNMVAENKEIGMNPPTAEEIVDGPAAVAEEPQVAEETAKATNIIPYDLAKEVMEFLYNGGYLPRISYTTEAVTDLSKHIEDTMGGVVIGEEPETLRNWEAAADAVNDILSKIHAGRIYGKNHLPRITAIKRAYGSRRKNSGFIQCHCRSNKVGGAYDVSGSNRRYVRPGPCADIKRRSGDIPRVFSKFPIYARI